MAVNKALFGTLKDGREVSLYTLENRQGMRSVVTDFGAILVKLFIPDSKGELRDIVLGYDELEKYQENFDMLGATVGRNVNRIENGRFEIDGVAYQLEINENGNNIHSSMAHGFHKVLWKAEQFSEDSISFSYDSPHMENGFPGNLEMSVTYTLTEKNDLILSYAGKSDRKTLLNPTNHSYFNLSGCGNGDILDTEVWINADQYTPLREGHIPTGELCSVEGTPFDFRTPRPIGKDLSSGEEQLAIVGGYDHNFVIRGYGRGLRRAAWARSPKTGVCMTVYTDLPGLQFYGGNTTRDIIGKGGALITKHSGFCMESHFFPNSINTPAFVQPVLEKDAPFRSTTIYGFTVEEKFYG